MMRFTHNGVTFSTRKTPSLKAIIAMLVAGLLAALVADSFKK